jgi:hypothetical protein
MKEVDLRILEKGKCIDLKWIISYLCTSPQHRGARGSVVG